MQRGCGEGCGAIQRGTEVGMECKERHTKGTKVTWRDKKMDAEGYREAWRGVEIF